MSILLMVLAVGSFGAGVWIFARVGDAEPLALLAVQSTVGSFGIAAAVLFAASVLTYVLEIRTMEIERLLRELLERLGQREDAP